MFRMVSRFHQLRFTRILDRSKRSQPRSVYAPSVSETQKPKSNGDLNAERLAALLSDRPGPVLTWFSPRTATEVVEGQGEAEDATPRERVELSGPVARRWLAKTDNFLDQEFPYGADTFAVDLPQHWRSPFWLLAPWLRGMELFDADRAADADLVVSGNVAFLGDLEDEGASGTLVAQTADSFALAWPGDLPAGVLDGTADILSYGDEVETPMTAPAHSVLMERSFDQGPPEANGDHALRLSDLSAVNYLGAEGPPPALGSLSGERALVTTTSLPMFSAQLLQLWLAGASVVWAPGGDTDEIAVVERVTMEVPNPKQ